MRTYVPLVISFIILLAVEIVKSYGPELSKAAIKEVGKASIKWSTEKALNKLSGAKGKQELQLIERQPPQTKPNITINIYIGGRQD